MENKLYYLTEAQVKIYIDDSNLIFFNLKGKKKKSSKDQNKLCHKLFCWQDSMLQQSWVF